MLKPKHERGHQESIFSCNTRAQPVGAHVNATKLIGLILIVGGVLALAFGGFSYTKDSSAVKVGPVELSVKQKETVNVPLWAGIGALVAGGLLLAIGKK